MADQWVILRHINSATTVVVDTAYSEQEAADRAGRLGRGYDYDLAEMAWMAKASG